MACPKKDLGTSKGSQLPTECSVIVLSNLKVVESSKPTVLFNVFVSLTILLPLKTLPSGMAALHIPS
jgi:hypothetical protein